MECRIVDLQDLAYGFLEEETAARVREHLDGCGRCRADFGRLTAEKQVLGRAAASPAGRNRPAATLVPLGFAAALLAGLLWLLTPARPPAAEVVAVPGAPAPEQDKGAKGSGAVPDTEDALRKEIARLDAALPKAGDEQERARIKTAIGDLQVRLDRLTRMPDEKTAMKEKPEGAPPKKPLVKESAEDRALKLKKESKDLFEKIKMSQDPAEKKQMEQRVRDIDQELKMLDLAKPQINIKDVEMRLQANPDDVAALVDRGGWHADNGRAEPAMKDLNRAIALKPDCAPAYLKRAIAYALMGKQAEAFADAKRGEQLDLKAGKMIDDTMRTIKKLTGTKERRTAPGDLENQIATLKERLEELKAMSASADLSEADRERAGRDAARVQAEIDRLAGDLKSRPAEAEKKPVQKK